nr:tigger transposable element-derived protein 4-like [Bactrocera oleae]
MLQEKANDFAARFSIIDFNCSAIWINRFKVRHNIVVGKIVGESSSVAHNLTTNWLISVWPNLRGQFSDDEIFNADGTGIFYKFLPDKTLKFQGVNCSGEASSTVFLTFSLNTRVQCKKCERVTSEQRMRSAQMSLLHNQKSHGAEYGGSGKIRVEFFEKIPRRTDVL